MIKSRFELFENIRIPLLSNGVKNKGNMYQSEPSRAQGVHKILTGLNEPPAADGLDVKEKYYGRP